MTELLSTMDVAKRLDVNDSTVRLWCRQGRFPHAQQVGRDWVIPRTDLEGFELPRMGRPPKSKANGKDGKVTVKPSKKGSKR